MKYGVYLALPCAVVALGVFGLTFLAGDRTQGNAMPPPAGQGDAARGESGSPAAPMRASPPPLSLEGFLDEKLPDAPAEREVLKADNFACYVCHANYETEELALVHARVGVGCAKCHGRSLEHCDDEAHEIPPDIMFALEEVDGQCATCHEGHDAPATEVLARYLERVPAKTNPSDVVCTDCHGEHRLARRTVWWDRKTREMVVREEGQQFKVRPDWSVPPREQLPKDKP